MLTAHYTDKRHIGKHVAPLTLDIDSRPMPVYDGFHYFSPLDLSLDGRYILLKDGEQVVGVILYDRFRTRSKDRAGNATHIGIYYVDVHRDYRKQGISQQLVAHLRAATEPPHVVELSPLTDDGYAAKLVQTFARHFRVQRVRD